ncbi:MAG TPA: SET domain-containing protein-lysine N-methyltransferase [Verrucomicrobiae bacterium]
MSKKKAKPAGTKVDASKVEVRKSGIHDTGCFAACDIRKGEKVIEYVGPHMSKAESAKQCEDGNVYVFTLNDAVDINGNVEWNPARFINHSCAPNCESENDDPHIWILAVRDIKAGEELTYNYGFDIEEYKDYPCNCGAKDCVGYMVAAEFFDHARKYRASQKEAATA